MYKLIPLIGILCPYTTPSYFFVLISDSEQNLQIMLDFVNNWCNKWQMKINNEKSKIVHFRRKTLPKTSFEFKVGCTTLEVTDSYRYSGVIFNEFLTFDKCVKHSVVWQEGH